MMRQAHLHLCWTVLGLALVCPARGNSQAVPTAVTPTILSPVPTLGGLSYELRAGTFRYGATASEVFQRGFSADRGTIYQTNLSGNVAYSTRSLRHPFSAVYSGGVLLANQSGYGTTFFQNLALTQSYATRTWNFGLSDTVSYLPQSPTVGLSGVPGTGDLGLSPVVNGGIPSQSILSFNSSRVSNTVTGDVSHQLTGRTSLAGDASYSLLHFFDNAAIDSRQISADLALRHQLDARTIVGVGVNYSIFNYDIVQNASFETRSVNLQLSRQLTRSLAAAGSLGPQWINGSSGLGIPSRLTTTANASLTYTKHFGITSLSYFRGTNGGSGVVAGSLSDSVGGSFARSFGRDWSAALSGGYSRSRGLATQSSAPNLLLAGVANYGNFDSTFGGAQVSRRLTRSLSAFGSYTASHQTYANFGTLGTDTRGALNGLLQTFAVGVSFYPRSLVPGQF